MENVKYECENCGDVFMDKHAKSDTTFCICPNCHSSDLVEVSNDTPLSEFYQS